MSSGRQNVMLSPRRQDARPIFMARNFPAMSALMRSRIAGKTRNTALALALLDIHEDVLTVLQSARAQPSSGGQ